jgi:hypothetical protein
LIQEREYIENSLYQVFTAMLQGQGINNIPVIHDNDEGIRPKPPFLAIEFRISVTPGQPNFSKVDLDGGGEVQIIRQFVRRSLTLHGFGKKAIEVLETIRFLLFVDQWVDELKRRKLVVPQIFEIMDTPSNIDNARENAASFDFDLTYMRVTEIEPSYIEDVELSREFRLN